MVEEPESSPLLFHAQLVLTGLCGSGLGLKSNSRGRGRLPTLFVPFRLFGLGDMSYHLGNRDQEGSPWFLATLLKTCGLDDLAERFLEPGSLGQVASPLRVSIS